MSRSTPPRPTSSSSSSGAPPVVSTPIARKQRGGTSSLLPHNNDQPKDITSEVKVNEALFSQIEREENEGVHRTGSKGGKAVGSGRSWEDTSTPQYGFIGATPDSADWLYSGPTPTPPSEQRKSLATKRRETHNDMEDEVDDYSEDFAKRYKITNYTSADSHLSEGGDGDGRALTTYYCSVCGSHCLIANVNLIEMPRRSTDGSIAINTRKWFAKRYMCEDDEASMIALQRPTGVEVQRRYTCRSCGMLLGYVCPLTQQPAVRSGPRYRASQTSTTSSPSSNEATRASSSSSTTSSTSSSSTSVFSRPLVDSQGVDLTATSDYLYIFQDTVVKDQSKAGALLVPATPTD